MQEYPDTPVKDMKSASMEITAVRKSLRVVASIAIRKQNSIGEVVENFLHFRRKKENNLICLKISLLNWS